MKTTLKTLGITMSFFCTINLTAQQLFKDSGQRLGNSVSWNVKLGDLDGDGDLDAVVANYDWNPGSTQKNEIWLNNGDATFTKSSQSLGSSSVLDLYDVNNDGHLDIIEMQDSIKIWINDGHANFTISHSYNFKGQSIVFDKKINNDNKIKAITLITSGYNAGDSTTLRIYSVENNTSHCDDSIVFNGFQVLGMAIGDLNNDGYSDLVIYQNGPNYILFNDKNGGFVKSDQELLGAYNTSSISLGDLNGDGYLDILQCNYHHPVTGAIFPAKFYLNDGTGHFTNVAIPYNSSYITPDASILDLDNDGDLDIYLNHGHRSSDLSHKSEILFNDGHGNFKSSTVALDLIPSSGTAFGDLDGDGDLDAFLACGIYNSDGSSSGVPNRVWLNTSADNDFVKTSSITLSSDSLRLNVGQKDTLIATVTPDNANIKLVTWQSDKPTVATVDAKGIIKAIALGSATIMARTVNGNHSDSCVVTVTNETTCIDVKKKDEIMIYPNPTTGLATIFFGTNSVQEAFVEIFNLQGKLVFSETSHNSEKTNIDLTEFPDGMYLVVASADKVIHVEKILKSVRNF